MSRLFISHSSNDNIAAIAFKQWLGKTGWPDEEVFLDLDSIGAGERWKEALRVANTLCEAVILLASPDALSSPECLAEVRKAEDFGKEIIVVLLRDLQFDDHRLDSYKDRQIVDLAAPPQTHVEMVKHRGEEREVRFNSAGLARVKDFLTKRGITPDRFAWPPENKPDAEPFPGLSAFTKDEAGIFFGRDADIVRGLDRLRILRRIGQPRLLVIQAASGAGKSSYLRAGLWPRLHRDPDFAPLAIIRPAQGILTGPEGLGRALATRLSNPGRPISPGEIHARLMAHDAAMAVADFGRFMTMAATHAHQQRRIGDREARAPALIVAVDQAEEMFGAENRPESDRFLLLLAEIMRNPPMDVKIFCLFTIRSDGAARLFQTIADLSLETPDTLPLLALPQTAFRDVILKPLEVLQRRGYRLTLSPVLAERLIADSTGADALPLLAFTISHLYREFGATGGLTLEQYESIGGVAGSIDIALKHALARPGDAPAIPSARDAQLATLRAAFIPWLARIDPNTGAPMRRVARLDEFPQHTRNMLARLVEARLLVAEHRSDADVVEVAHESLLRQWATLAAWLEADSDDLRIVDAVERAAVEWARNSRREPWLDHRGERLLAAERAANRSDFRERLDKTGIAYLTACRSRAQARPRFLQRTAMVIASILVLGVTLLRAVDPTTVSDLRQRIFFVYQELQPRTYRGVSVSVVAIDEVSLAALGRWPWPRTLLASLLQRLRELGATVIAFDALFAESSGINAATFMHQFVGVASDPDTPTVMAWLNRHHDQSDNTFADVIARSPVVLGFYAAQFNNVERPPAKAKVNYDRASPDSEMMRFSSTLSNLAAFDKAASGLGVINMGAEVFGITESIPLVLSDGKAVFPSLVVEVLRVAQHQHSLLLRGTGVNGSLLDLSVGGFNVPLSADGAMRLYYDDGRRDRYTSAKDVLDTAEDRTVRARIAGRIVFVGTSAAGVGTIKLTPRGQTAFTAGVFAQAVEQVIGGDFLIRPKWAEGFETAATFLIGSSIALLILIFGAQIAAVIGLAITVVACGCAWVAFSRFGILFDPTYPLLGATCVYIAVASPLVFATDDEKATIRQQVVTGYLKVAPNK